MRNLIFLITLGFWINVHAVEIAWINPLILGAPGTNNLVVFSGGHTKDCLYPESVQLDFRNGVIYGAKAIYPKTTGLYDLRDILNEAFFPIKPREFGAQLNKSKMYVWRDEVKRFAASICRDSEEDGKLVLLLVSIDKKIRSGKQDAETNPAPTAPALK